MLRRLLLIVLIPLIGCGASPKASIEKTTKTTPDTKESSPIRETINDAVDATITHKSQINAFLRSKKQLKAFDAKQKQMMQDLDIE